MQSALRAGTVVDQAWSVDEVKDALARPKKLLADLSNPKNTSSTEGRFDLAYTAAHGYLQMALRMKGYRTTTEKGHRAVLFELIPELVPGAAGSQEILAQAHTLRNQLHPPPPAAKTGNTRRYGHNSPR